MRPFVEVGSRGVTLVTPAIKLTWRVLVLFGPVRRAVSRMDVRVHR